MDFSWSPQQAELFEAIARFAAAELNHDLVENDRSGTFNLAGWKKCGEMGIQGLAVPVGEPSGRGR
jgi:alkylation response protein AidB-like acyl-CoA dehydrogenase